MEEGGGFQNGMNYQRLEEECWQSEPNLASEIRRDNRGAENQGHQGAESGFRREKKIFDDDNDEHVLYFQWTKSAMYKLCVHHNKTALFVSYVFLS